MKLPGSLCRKNYSPLDPDPEPDAASQPGEKVAPPVEATPPPLAPKIDPSPEANASPKCDFDEALSKSRIQLALMHCATVTVLVGGQQVRYTAPAARTLPPPPASDSPLTGAARDGYVASIKGQVVTMLIDPRSAKFRDVAYKEKPKGTAVCGFVSSKNGYGVDAGESKFVAIGSALYLYKDSDSNVPAAGRLAWNAFCN